LERSRFHATSTPQTSHARCGIVRGRGGTGTYVHPSIHPSSRTPRHATPRHAPTTYLPTYTPVQSFKLRTATTRYITSTYRPSFKCTDHGVLCPPCVLNMCWTLTVQNGS
jgi:hypothetical protein